MCKTTLKDGITVVQFEWRVFLFSDLLRFAKQRKNIDAVPS
jgi:hypothetical protein